LPPRNNSAGRDAAPVVDARGLRCPWPVLRAARAMRHELSIILIADDPIAQKDVPELARANGWDCTVENRAETTHFTLSWRAK
jgi:tRNA 2-thiouridine synthesizing protein A